MPGPSERPAGRRPLRAVAAWGGVLAALAVLAWQIAAWWAERPLSFEGYLGPTCGKSVDARYRDAVPRVENQIRAMAFSRRIPGLSVAVGVRGRIVYQEGFLYADREAGRRACPETQFRVGSVSKLFTVAAMARLAEAGALDLDVPVQRYVPSFPPRGAPITAALLASHRAGIRPYRDDREAIDTTRYPTVTASLRRFETDPLVAAPGTRFVYSNYGYVLLSAAIEGAAKQDFLTFVRRAVFTPLGMRSTVPDEVGADLPDRATTYDTDTAFSPDGRLARSPAGDFSGRWASGGFLSTTPDLVRFGSAFVARDSAGTPFLSPRTIAMLFRPRSGLPPLAGYGMGWMTATDLHLRRVHFQLGTGSGGTAVLAVYPGPDVVVAVAANLGDARIPFRALVNVVRPFLPTPWLDLIVTCLAAAYLWVFVVRRVARARRASPAGHRAV